MSTMNNMFLAASDVVWTWFVVPLCVLIGLFFTFRLAFIQFRSFPHAIALLSGRVDDTIDSKGISTFQALATALSGTTGIGNIAGVAVAIKLGGPGAVFWMWIMALIGMALKYAEATLGNLYRGNVSDQHEIGGGPMYYIVRGLGERWRPLAVAYSVCAAIACLGAWNMFQSNQASATMQSYFGVPGWMTGTVMCVFVWMVLIGGIQRIGAVAARLVPFMCVVYVGGVLVICLMNIQDLPGVMLVILRDAFGLDAAGGGAAGTALIYGIRRAVFSNEAGTGSAAIAHAAAHTKHAVRQGVVASLGPFIDTIVICAATAFVIILSGLYGSNSLTDYGKQYSFEKSAAATNWEVADASMHAAVNIRPVMDGERVLRYRDGLQHETRSMDLSGLLSQDEYAPDALRFSAYIDGADLEAQMVDADGKVLLAMPVSNDWQRHQSDDGVFEASLNGARHLDRWNTYVIRPNATLMDMLVNGGESTPSLRFVAAGDGVVEIDAVGFARDLNGIVLSAAAFASFIDVFGAVFIPIAALLFAYTTVLAGNYYGEIACHFLDQRLVKPYMWLYVAATFVGCVVNLSVVINFSDLMLGLMCIPNMIAILLLRKRIYSATSAYFSKPEHFARGVKGE